MDKIQNIDIIDIEMDQAFPFAGDGSLSHTLLGGREASDQHPITSIKGLKDALDDLGTTERVYSNGNGLGEYRRWYDGNPKGEDRSGYFVSIVPGTDEIEICDSTHDVYGISVSQSGFVGNQNSLYKKGNVLVNNRSNDTSYAIVGIIGAMRVRTDGTAINGDYVVPNMYGEATPSKNKYGYKVISTNNYASGNFVTIAITPQSDALSRLESSVAGGDLGELLIKIDTVERDVNGLEVKVDASAKDVQDILGELGNVRDVATTAEQVAKSAKTDAEDAQAVAIQAKDEALQAAQDARDAADGAIKSANDALSSAKDLSDDLSPILSWETTNGESNGVQGFVTQVNGDHTLLASMMTGNFPTGESLSAIIQKVDKHGAAIQHLTSHIDKYSVGLYSLTYGLTYNEATSILTQEHVYVPTTAREENLSVLNADGEIVETKTFIFEKPEEHLYSYKWIPENGTWERQTRLVYVSTVYIDAADAGLGIAVDDLWYCINDVLDVPEGVAPFECGSLYIWTGSMWSWVASIDDNYQSRIITNMRQTEASIISDVVALDGRTTSAEQNIEKITTRVSDAEGNISTINQEISTINSTIATANGNISSLQQQANDTDASITAIASGTFPQVYREFAGTAPEAVDGKKYIMPPAWDDDTGEFVFYGDVVENGVYYFYSEDKTKYCHVRDNGYDIYTVGKETTAMLDDRVSATEASITALAEFDTETTESLANITERVEENEASITFLTSRYNHILIGVHTEEVPVVGDYKYTKEPEWNSVTGEYEFDLADRSEDGAYYMADEDNQSYCKVITLEDGTMLYEIYGLVGGSLAAVEQKVDENSSSIGLVVERIENVVDESGNLTDESIAGKGSIIIQAINGESMATINADRIKLTGTDSITLTVANAATTAENNAEATAQTLASQAETNAKEYTDEELKDYSTTTEMNSAINQKADSIASSVNTTLKNYSTTTAMNSAIEQKANNITSTVASTYATKDSLGSYATTTKVAQVEQKVDANASSIKLVVENNAVKGSILVEAINNQSSATISANKINLNGYVTVSSLGANGTTIIDGSRITTGLIKSSNYSYTSGTYSTAGMQINLSNGALTSKNFAIDASGNAYFKGQINATSGYIGSNTGWSITSNGMWNGGTEAAPTLYFGTAGVNATINGLSRTHILKLGNNFGVMADGSVFASGANIVSALIASSTLLQTNISACNVFGKLSLLNTNSAALLFKYDDSKILSSIDAYMSDSKYYTRWHTDDSNIESVIKIHSGNGGVSLDAGPNKRLEIGTLEANYVSGVQCGQTINIGSRLSGAKITLYGPVDFSYATVTGLNTVAVFG